MAVRTCTVTCRDAQGVGHTVQVTAQTLFEAVAQALRAFREHEWSDEPTGSTSVVVTTNQRKLSIACGSEIFRLGWSPRPRALRKWR
jgi:hypothetical protein